MAGIVLVGVGIGCMSILGATVAGFSMVENHYSIVLVIAPITYSSLACLGHLMLN